jgi:L-ribulose-5-phosphate 3-epimerase
MALRTQQPTGKHKTETKLMSTRREFITKSILATTGASIAMNAAADVGTKTHIKQSNVVGANSISIFSKNLHWLGYEEMADAVAKMGFDGIDLTVRPEGHVLPERVTTDLPKAVDIIRKAGLKVHMITTAINNPDDANTEPILKTAGSLGIPYYRMGWISYDDKLSMDDNLKSCRVKMTKLAALNKKYSIHGDYQNHAGANFGSPTWDLWLILKDLDPRWIGCQYDVRHAMVEGANSWPLGLKLLKSHIRTMDIKDYIWSKSEKGWRAETVPLGEGMVDFKKFFTLLKQHQIQGPFSIHYEYPLGGAENGAKTITIPKEDVFTAMKKDLATFKQLTMNN